MANFELNVKLNGIEQSVSSIGELEQALAATNKQLSQVEENSKEFKFLENQASNLEKVLGALTTDANNFNKSLKGVENTSKQLNNSFNQTAEAASEMADQGTRVRGLNNEIKGAATTTQSLRAELRQIVQELQTLEPGSARFQELSARAGQLRDTIGDTNQVVNALAGTAVERLGRSLQTTVQLGIAGFQGIAGATALFGVESESLQQTMVKLTALLNLSQAVEAFGGLGDKITLITAGFKSLFPAAQNAATATSTAAVATTAEGAASAGAATATSAFAVALNALPLVAIITALGLLTAGLINYASGSDEAAKAEEERNKKLDEQKQLQEQTTEATAKEGTELVLLLNRLKATNAGSKERANLINEINANYGVGLKNLQDETAFQNQATTALKDYITQLKNKVALRLIEAEAEKLVEKQIANQTAIDQLTNKNAGTQILVNKGLQENFDIRNNWLRQQGIVIDRYNDINSNLLIQRKNESDLAEGSIENNKNQIKQLEAANAVLDKQIADLSKKRDGYATMLEGAFDKITTSTEKGSKATEDANRKEEEALNNLGQFLQKVNDDELALQRSRIQRTKDRTDDIEFEKDVALSSIIQEYEAQKKAIENNVQDETKRKKLLLDLEIAFTKRVQLNNDKAADLNKELLAQQLKDHTAYLNDLTKAYFTLQSEITYGNNNVADQRETLAIRINEASIQELEFQLENNKMSLKDYEATQKRRLQLLQENADLQLLITKNVATAEAQVQIDEIVKYYDDKGRYAIQRDAETGKYTVKINQETIDKIAKDDTKALQDAENEAKLVEGVINQSAVNLNSEANSKKFAADVQYDTDRKNNALKTDEEIAQSRMAMAENLLFIFQQLNQALNEIEAGITAKQEAETTRQNELFAAGQQQRADALEAAYQADIAANNYTEDQKKEKRLQTDAAIRKIQDDTNKAVDASNRKLAEKQFKRQKQLNIVSAIINGAQAIMQGIAQFGPPPSPMGIAAIALAGIITAAQVAAISAQKFDGGSTGAPTSVSTPEVNTSTPSVASSSMNNLGGGFTSFTSTATGAPTGQGSTFTPFEGGMQKVYVVESDISSTQNRVRVLENNSTFG